MFSRQARSRFGAASSLDTGTSDSGCVAGQRLHRLILLQRPFLRNWQLMVSMLAQMESRRCNWRLAASFGRNFFSLFRGIAVMSDNFFRHLSVSFSIIQLYTVDLCISKALCAVNNNAPLPQSPMPVHLRESVLAASIEQIKRAAANPKMYNGHWQTEGELQDLLMRIYHELTTVEKQRGPPASKLDDELLAIIKPFIGVALCVHLRHSPSNLLSSERLQPTKRLFHQAAPPFMVCFCVCACHCCSNNTQRSL